MGRKRRDDIREETIDDIKRAAREMMAEQGTGGLSIRAIARKVDVTPSALYWYFENLDALITVLIVDNFNAFAEALEQARDTTDGRVLDKLSAVMWAYRQWARDNPVDFQLIYGNPIPGYHAPRELTVPASARGLAVFVQLLEEALQSGECNPPEPYNTVPPEFEAHLQQIIADGEYPISTLSLYLSNVAWGPMHGIVMLELFGHIGPVIGDVDALYRVQIQQLAQMMGFTV